MRTIKALHPVGLGGLWMTVVLLAFNNLGIANGIWASICFIILAVNFSYAAD